jgi:hypothetical protein
MLSFCFCFGAGVCTQSLELAMQMFYYLSHVPVQDSAFYIKGNRNLLQGSEQGMEKRL